MQKIIFGKVADCEPINLYFFTLIVEDLNFQETYFLEPLWVVAFAFFKSNFSNLTLLNTNSVCIYISEYK